MLFLIHILKKLSLQSLKTFWAILSHCYLRFALNNCIKLLESILQVRKLNWEWYSDLPLIWEHHSQCQNIGFLTSSLVLSIIATGGSNDSQGRRKLWLGKGQLMAIRTLISWACLYVKEGSLTKRTGFCMCDVWCMHACTLHMLMCCNTFIRMEASCQIFLNRMMRD